MDELTEGGTYAFGADTNNNPSSVFALNGVLYVGTNGASSTGLYAIDFINDRLYRYNTTDRNLGDKQITNRNTTVTYNAQSNTITKFIGAGSVQVNDVHGTIVYGGSSILTNGGPLNGATFICAATDDGIQVLNLTTQKITPYGDANITRSVLRLFHHSPCAYVRLECYETGIKPLGKPGDIQQQHRYRSGSVGDRCYYAIQNMG